LRKEGKKQKEEKREKKEKQKEEESYFCTVRARLSCKYRKFCNLYFTLEFASVIMTISQCLLSFNINIKQLKNVFAGGWIDGNLFSQCNVTSVECCFENDLLKGKIILLGKMKKNFVVIT
jgi:hypothetical protein